MDAFRPFSLTHAAALLGIAAVTWWLVRIGRKSRDTVALTRLEKTMAIVNLVFVVAAHAWWMLPPRFDPAVNLPLQMCHLASLIASLALLTRWRWTRVLLYFWGIGLCTQALITPGLTDSPASIWFWAFWFQHGFIIVAAVYDLAVRGFRPDWKDYRTACVASVLYVAAVLPLDLVLGANYGFVGDTKPAMPTLIDLLGPWPRRVVVIVALVAAVMALMMLPWRIAAARRHGTDKMNV
jgi:hypothetical integral membrane protein (TIGR02206 family)